MRDMFITLYALFIPWLLGYNFMLATGLRRKNDRSSTRAAAEFCIGAGLLYFILFTGSLITGRLTPAIIYVLLFLLLLFNFSKGNIYFKRPSLPDRREAMSLLLAMGLLILLFLPSLNKGPGWDAWAIWAFKAKAFYVDGYINHHFLGDMERYAYAHPDYPLLLPLLEYWVYFHLDNVNDHVIRLAPLGFWLFMLLFFCSTLLDRVKTSVALLTLTLLSLIWPLTQNVLISSVDAIQAFYNLAGMVYLFKWFEEEDNTSFWTGALILALGMNVKNEGLALWTAAACVLLLFSAVAMIRKGPTRLYFTVFFFLTGAAVSALWIIDKTISGIESELFIRGIPSPEMIWERSGELLRFYIGQIINFGYPGWGLLWIFFILALFKMLACGDLKKESYRFFLATCLFHMLALFIIYCITPYDLTYHLQTSGNRTLLQLVPALFWIGTVSLFSEQNRIRLNPHAAKSLG